jgi:cysteine sulfinate desulfinase/cysteine desulfurase-like protein
VAKLIGASGREIIFTSCATESNNAAIHAALKANPGKRHIVTSAVEHSSVLNLCHALRSSGRQSAPSDFRKDQGRLTSAPTVDNGNYRVTYLPVDRDGLLKLADLESAITDETAVVSLMWANNETGVLFPVQEIAEVCRARGVLFHCDAVQAAGKVEIDVRQVQADYLSLSGHKFHAPKGVGALYVRRKTPFSPLIHGGHQERNLRAGTECVPLIVGLGKAAELACKQLPSYEQKVRPLRDALEAGILGVGSSGRESAPSDSPRDQSRLTSAATKRNEGAGIPNTELNGHKSQRLANTTTVSNPRRCCCSWIRKVSAHRQVQRVWQIPMNRRMCQSQRKWRLLRTRFSRAAHCRQRRDPMPSMWRRPRWQVWISC